MSDDDLDWDQAAIERMERDRYANKRREHSDIAAIGQVSCDACGQRSCVCLTVSRLGVGTR